MIIDGSIKTFPLHDVGGPQREQRSVNIENIEKGSENEERKKSFELSYRK